ncbi:Spy/CpxP family protein refolding chaperone [Litorisediminicola beolgyonensis]|uniref:Spy/CpxP family protein refolding chaperone n=1 Tax=Litorisediminicola beolgyonensis TaxID=1173614 RepID=A0ABW3ZCD0_9RHOB
MIRCTSLLAAALTAAWAVAAQATETQPYAGQDSRGIAALSEDDIAALRAGEGWGFAKPAELNGYPGPAHVLDLAEKLSLEPDQEAKIAAIFEAMRSEAVSLGRDYVAAEAALDAAFEAGDLSSETLRALVAEAETTRAELRAVHLAAHLETTPLLTRHQRMIYAQARGYGAPGGDDHTGHDGH